MTIDAERDTIVKEVAELNRQDVSIEYGIFGESVLISKIQPIALVMPEGWHVYREAFSGDNGTKKSSLPKITFFKPQGGIWPCVALCDI